MAETPDSKTPRATARGTHPVRLAAALGIVVLAAAALTPVLLIAFGNGSAAPPLAPDPLMQNEAALTPPLQSDTAPQPAPIFPDEIYPI